MKTLAGKVALITGSSKGIGAEIARRMAEAGARVVVNYAGSEDAAAAVVQSIRDNGGEAVAVQADVSKVADVKRLFAEGIKHFGRIDVLVNNAGVMINKKIEDATDEDFDHLFGVNVKGVFNTLREAADQLADNGRVINMSSTVLRMMLPTYGLYCGTKAAVEQMTRIFAKEIGHRGITVNSVAPGPTETDLFMEGKSEEMIDKLISMNAFGRLGQPADIAQVVVFLASDASAWVTAQNICVNGGTA